MDPTVALAEIREKIDAIFARRGQQDIEENTELIALADQVRELDRWMSTGGFHPEPWRSLRPQRVSEAEFTYWKSR